MNEGTRGSVVENDFIVNHCGGSFEIFPALFFFLGGASIAAHDRVVD